MDEKTTVKRKRHILLDAAINIVYFQGFILFFHALGLWVSTRTSYLPVSTKKSVDLWTFLWLEIFGTLGQSHGTCFLTFLGKINIIFMFLVRTVIYIYIIYISLSSWNTLNRNNICDNCVLLDCGIWISVYWPDRISQISGKI